MIKLPISTVSIQQEDTRLTQFIHDRFDIYPPGQVSATALYAAWLDWCGEHAEPPGTFSNFSRCLTAWGLPRGRKARGNVYFLIVPKEPHEEKATATQ